MAKKAKTDTLFKDLDPKKPYCIGWHMYLSRLLREYLPPNEEG